ALYEALSTRDVSGSLMHFEENYPRKLQPKKSTRMELFSVTPLSPMARLLLEETTNHITFTDIDGRILFANTAAQRSTGYTLDEMRENTPRLWGGLMGHDFYEQLWKTIKTERKPFVDKITNRKKSGIL
ncbi:MAG: PAS domain S-box protein, partial [Candidatus Uhrbacteria bacterium]|nr:PAS domain S-box protein [Candidatus Uhrbacteria bacterium]